MKKVLWLFLADAANSDATLALPAVAWMAQDAGAQIEGYLEARRDGQLFGGWGSTVLGGAHHQQFNYLNAVFDVRYVLLGQTAVFDSSLRAFGAQVLARADILSELYTALLEQPGVRPPSSALFAPAGPVQTDTGALDLSPYLFPEIYHRRALAFSGPDADGAAQALLHAQGVTQVAQLYLADEERRALEAHYPAAQALDVVRAGDTYGSVTLRVAGRWKEGARGVAFGDPAAIRAQLATLCREGRVAVYGEKVELHPADVQVGSYTEAQSEIASKVTRLALETGNPLLVGRQTGDGDLFEWSRGGVAMQIMDPNRPAFPVVQTVVHPWAAAQGGLFDEEPGDEELRQFAREGKVLASLVWHSGETAHNEAMLNLFDLAAFLGLKMGYGVHAARYETSPQLWELMQVPRGQGGMLGLVEPLLHSGGLGVLAETNCPPERLREHCEAALTRIRILAGEAGTPRGYYAFMDAALETLSPGSPALYDAVAASGLDYMVSSARPGRNRLIHTAGNFVALNQSARSVAHASPFVRVTTLEELNEDVPKVRPAWMIATLDAPVIAFNPYIWREGSRFMKIADWLRSGEVVNVLPHTAARYARLLNSEGYLPGGGPSLTQQLANQLPGVTP